MDRRHFLKVATATLVTACGGAGYYLWKKSKSLGAWVNRIPCRLETGGTERAHLLQEPWKQPAAEMHSNKVLDVVIVGAGVSGLSAARTLKKEGIKSFALLELEDLPGGNCYYGKNEISAYPWGSHYLPVPSKDAKPLIEFLREEGAVEGTDVHGNPQFNEYFLCTEPMERMLMYGTWQEGFIPHAGVPEKDRQQIQAFLDTMHGFRKAKGRDGKKAFALPLEDSSQDTEFLKYDQLSMSDYLRQNGWTSNHLRWYVNYGCRDDYGSTLETTSAWAGIHYFACREAEGENITDDAVLTWPEGNGWITDRLAKQASPHVQCGTTVLRIKKSTSHPDSPYSIHCRRHQGNTDEVLQAKSIIFAAPRFVAAHVIEGYDAEYASFQNRFEYTPWLIANLSVSELPGGPGAPLSWDNISYHSEALGYVVATHQGITQEKKKSVLTFYWPLTHATPTDARRWAALKTPDEWKALILKELEGMHPGYGSCVERIDIRLLGHSMIRPEPGFIWGPERKKRHRPWGRIWFANTDMSGSALVQEAFALGQSAAHEILRQEHGIHATI